MHFVTAGFYRHRLQTMTRCHTLSLVHLSPFYNLSFYADIFPHFARGKMTQLRIGVKQRPSYRQILIVVFLVSMERSVCRIGSERLKSIRPHDSIVSNFIVIAYLVGSKNMEPAKLLISPISEASLVSS